MTYKIVKQNEKQAHVWRLNEDGEPGEYLGLRALGLPTSAGPGDVGGRRLLMFALKRSTICRWLGHKRFPLDDEKGNVVNVDGCKRCGVILVANQKTRRR